MFFRAAGTPQNPKVQVSWNKYNTSKGVADICTRLAKAYPDLVTMESAGKSSQGRDIIVLTITDKKVLESGSETWLLDRREYSFNRNPGN